MIGCRLFPTFSDEVAAGEYDKVTDYVTGHDTFRNTLPSEL